MRKQARKPEEETPRSNAAGVSPQDKDTGENAARDPDETGAADEGEQDPSEDAPAPTGAEDDADAEDEGDQRDAQEDGQQDAPPAVENPQPDPAEAAEDPEKAQLRADLLNARCQLAAFSAGVAPDKAADAVTLAVAQVRAGGDDVTEEAVAAAMKDVLARNPEWKAAGGKKSTGGFKLGADPDSRPAARKEKERAGSKKPWNKFNR